MSRHMKDLLSEVSAPSRYLGDEVNAVRKDPESVRGTVALCYPDVYEIGMSHIGLRILYKILNDVEDIQAERVYTPWPDMEAALRRADVPLSTLECGRPLSSVDVLGFTLQYELSYSNILTTLDLGGIPLRAADRRREDPVVIAGGPCAFNPEPLSMFMDAVCLGDGEETILRVVEAVLDWRAGQESRSVLYDTLATIPGVYVPSLYATHRGEDGGLQRVEALRGAPIPVKKAIVTDLDSAPYPTSQVVPSRQVVHDRYGVEIQRGCMRGCRFCQAGYIYRPERQRRPETVRRLVREGLEATGIEEYSLLSLSAGDYDCIETLLQTLMDEHEDSHSAISMPSMRLETLTPALVEQIERVRQTSFTVAPEAASDRMRAVINKVIDEQALLDAVDIVFRHGWKSLKLYFMIGLPTEQRSDLDAMVSLGKRCLERARRHRKGARITVSVSSFVPKSHTPFQWVPQIGLEEIRERQNYLRDQLRRAGVDFRCHDARESVMEGVFSRGGRDAGELLLRAWELGARFDGWSDQFNESAWQQACAEQGVEPEGWNARRREPDEVLPWSHISTGLDPQWLWDDWMHSLEAGFVADCSTSPCYDCGVCDHTIVKNEIFDKDDAAMKARPRTRKAFRKADRGAGARIIQLSRRQRAEKDALNEAAPPARKPVAKHQTEHFLPGMDAASFPSTTRLPKEYRGRLRLRYRRTGSGVWMAHLEVVSAFQRAVRRAGLDVIYSSGFHPHPRLTFAPPAPAGVETLDDILDIELRLPFDPTEVAAAIAAKLPGGFEVFSAETASDKGIGTRYQGARYLVVPGPELDRERLDKVLAGESVLAKVTRKRKTREFDLVKVMHELTPLEGGAFSFLLPATGGAPLRAIFKALFGDDMEPGGALRVRRLEVLLAPEEPTRTPPSAPKRAATPAN